MAMGYEEIKELISETLANRPKGTEITPETHQELEMQLLEYIRSIELSSNAPFIDIATADTDPVQPDDSRVCYIATLSPSERVTFTNFHGQDGRAITITASTFQPCIVFLIWNTAYWESEIITLSSLGKATSEGGEIFNDYVNNKANQYGHAEGQNTTAEGLGAHAEGRNTKAIGNYAHTEGQNTTAEGLGAHAEGRNTKAIGYQSHAEGYNTQATGYQSHAEGYNTQAKTGVSHAEGSSTIAEGLGAHAEGLNTTATGNYAHAEGQNTTATGNQSHAEGQNTTATGRQSHAEGQTTTATGRQSHAENAGAEASGVGSHAEGFYTKAEGSYSHAEGSYTKAQGSYSHAGGVRSEVSGEYGFTHGYYTVAPNYAQFSIGVYNEIGDSPNPDSYDATKRAFSIGNDPTGRSRSDAFRVLGNGTVYADNTTIQPTADYAEMFEWLDGNPEKEDRVGYIVALSGDKIIKATGKEGEMIVGIISGAPTVLGDAPMRWKNKYLNDEWGRPIYETIEFSTTQKQILEDEDGNVILDEEGKVQYQEVQVKERAYVRKLNPDYNPKEDYIPREERPEWSAVGLLGKVLVRQDGTLKAGEYCRPNENGVATKSDGGFYVLEVISETQAKVLVK